MAGSVNKSNTNDVLKQWYQLFSDQENSIRSAHAYAHWKNVERLGLPTQQHEHWKYTPLEKFLAHRFVPPAAARAITKSDCDTLSLELDACRLVFVDGLFSPVLSDINTDAWHIEVGKDSVYQSLPDPIQSEVFLHLIESLSQETTYIRLPMGEIASKPLYLLHISQGYKDEERLSTLHYRHHINIEAGAQGQVIEHFVSMDQQAHFSGARTTIVVGNNANLNHIKLAFESHSSYHFSHDDFHVNQNASVNISTVILGAGLTRHQISVQLNGEASDLFINSLLILSRQDIGDMRTYVDHNKGHCLSRQLHKIISQDCSKGVFNGLIKVAKNALKTDAQMINNNLLLDQAEIDTKPQLEIYTDDIKCSHAATIGRIDEEQMFYLRSRGVTQLDAQKMLICAFIKEVIKRIGHDAVCNIILRRASSFL